MTAGTARNRSRRARLVTVAVVVALSAAAVGGFAALRGHADDTTGAEAPETVATSPVVRETLVRSDRHAGTVGFGEPRSVGGAPSTGSGDEGAEGSARTVTWLPEVGTVIDRGHQAWRTDDLPTVAFFGGLPVYRELGVGVRGADVAQLKENLVALGYGGFSTDDRFTPATSRAVRAWQKDVGLPQTGRLTPEQVVVVGGPVRVASRSVEVGAAQASPMLSVTDVRRVVSFTVDPSKSSPPDVGATGTVVLPDGARVPASVAGVSPPEEQDDDGADGGGTVTVEVALEDPAVLDGMDAGRVDVEFDLEERPDVLTVPVTALVSLAEGGYAVEVGAQERRLVPVTTGMFASGRVEVTGEVVEGDEVVVPS